MDYPEFPVSWKVNSGALYADTYTKMGVRQALQIVGCFLVSLLATWGAFSWSAGYYQRHETAVGLNWAHQISTQIDLLSLQAGERGAGGRDGLSWAVSVYSQGEEPRISRVYKIETGAGTQSAQAESYRFDPETGVFDYSKILSPESGKGIRLQLQLGYTGFLGSRSKTVNDALTMGLFSLVYLFLFFVTVWKFGLAGEKKLKILLGRWFEQARVILNQFGTHVRELLRGEKVLTASAAECNAILTTLDAALKAELEELARLRGNLEEMAKLNAKADTLALSAAIEAARFGPQGKRVGEIIAELHKLIQVKKDLDSRCVPLSQGIDARLSGCANDVYSASQIAQRLFGATKEINARVRDTTGVVMDQARLMKELNEQLGQMSREHWKGLRTELPAKDEAASKLKP